MEDARPMVALAVVMTLCTCVCCFERLCRLAISKGRNPYGGFVDLDNTSGWPASTDPQSDPASMDPQPDSEPIPEHDQQFPSPVKPLATCFNGCCGEAVVKPPREPPTTPNCQRQLIREMAELSPDTEVEVSDENSSERAPEHDEHRQHFGEALGKLPDASVKVPEAPQDDSVKPLPPRELPDIQQVDDLIKAPVMVPATPQDDLVKQPPELPALDHDRVPSLCDDTPPEQPVSTSLCGLQIIEL